MKNKKSEKGNWKPAKHRKLLNRKDKISQNIYVNKSESECVNYEQHNMAKAIKHSFIFLVAGFYFIYVVIEA